MSKICIYCGEQVHGPCTIYNKEGVKVCTGCGHPEKCHTEPYEGCVPSGGSCSCS